MDFKNLRKQMVKTLNKVGISNSKILKVISKVERHKFVNNSFLSFSYENKPLPLIKDQTISQPYTIAFMLEALDLKKGNKVLEVGTGSGYNAALLSNLVYPGIVYSTEIVKDIYNLAKENLKNYSKNYNKFIKLFLADGSLGLPEFAPFDKIIVTAACPEIPKTLIKQLKNNGVLVAPVGKYSQEMLKITKINNEIKTESLGYFVFVPLKGKEGF